jgi:hypothetical protein
LRGLGLDRSNGGEKIGIRTVVKGQSVIDRLALDAARRTTPTNTSALFQHPYVNALLDEHLRAG